MSCARSAATVSRKIGQIFDSYSVAQPRFGYCYLPCNVGIDNRVMTGDDVPQAGVAKPASERRHDGLVHAI